MNTGLDYMEVTDNLHSRVKSWGKSLTGMELSSE